MMPLHRVYLEPFLGSGVVLGRKAPAEWEIGIDLDAAAINSWNHRQHWRAGPVVMQGNAIQILSSWAAMADPSWLFYLDPPYLGDVRTRRLYRCELYTQAAHRRLLTIVRRLPCHVMLSGYWSSLYASMLATWRCERFPAMTRGGAREECVWCNFPSSIARHDTRFIGTAFGIGSGSNVRSSAGCRGWHPCRRRNASSSRPPSPKSAIPAGRRSADA